MSLNDIGNAGIRSKIESDIPDQVTPKMDPDTFEFWFIDKKGKTVIIPEEEYNRQQIELAQGRIPVPSAGFPRLSGRMSQEKIPAGPNPPPTNPEPDPNNPPVPTDEEIADAEEIANSPEKLAQWKTEELEVVRKLREQGRIDPRRLDDIQTKLNDIEPGKARDVASVRLHLDEIPGARRQLRRKAEKTPTDKLAAEEKRGEKTRLLQRNEELTRRFEKQGTRMVSRIKAARTNEDLAALREEIEESLRDNAGTGTQRPRDTDQELPADLSGLDPKKFKDHTLPIGDPGGFGTPWETFYTHPDAPRNPDGTLKRFSKEEVARLTQPSGGGVSGGSTNERGSVLQDPSIGKEKEFDWRNPDKHRYVGVELKGVREIMANERDKNLFGETFITSLNNPDAKNILLRYNNNTPKEGDMTFLTAAAKEFSLRVKYAQEAAALMKDKDVELLARRDPHFENLLGHEGWGKEGLARATEIVHASIYYKAMQSPGGAEKLVNSLNQLGSDRNTFRFNRLENGWRNLSERSGIPYRDVEKAFDMGSPENWAHSRDTRERRHATKLFLEKRIHEKAGKFRKAIDWLSEMKIGWKETKVRVPSLGSSRALAIRLMAEADRLNYHRGPTAWVRERIDENLTYITEYLGPAIRKPEVRSLMAKEALTNQNQKLPGRGGPQTFAETQQLSRDRYSQGSIEGRIRALTQQADWPRGNSPVDIDTQNSMLSNMYESEKREQAGEGLFAWLIRMWLGDNWGKAANSALGRTVNFSHA